MGGSARRSSRPRRSAPPSDFARRAGTGSRWSVPMPIHIKSTMYCECATRSSRSWVRPRRPRRRCARSARCTGARLPVGASPGPRSATTSRPNATLSMISSNGSDPRVLARRKLHANGCTRHKRGATPARPSIGRSCWSSPRVAAGRLPSRACSTPSRQARSDRRGTGQRRTGLRRIRRSTGVRRRPATRSSGRSRRCAARSGC